MEAPAQGFLRSDLYIGTAQAVVSRDSIRRADAVTLPSSRPYKGDARLSGTVVTVEGQPVSNAQVSITDGPEIRTNERGEWILVGAPLGTRMLIVRAVGYYPQRRRVDVIAGGAHLRVALPTLKSVLDTVRVTAARDENGFAERRRSGAGRYLTAQDIARRQPFYASDIFRTVPGVTMNGPITMRGPFGSCTPALYIDGKHVPATPGGLMPHDIDDWMVPKEIKGIEIYYDLVPPQFQKALSGCGSIVIWTK